jgi:hypothetical protein
MSAIGAERTVGGEELGLAMDLGPSLTGPLGDEVGGVALGLQGIPLLVEDLQDVRRHRVGLEDPGVLAQPLRHLAERAEGVVDRGGP